MKNCLLMVSYNDSKSVSHLVNNIKDYKVIDHILIVDNNSRKDEVIDLEKLNSKKVELLCLDTNLGYPGAINEGAKYIIDKYGDVNFIISNSDVVIMSEEDLTRMIELLNNELIGLIGPQILERGTINRGIRNISPKKDFLLGVPLINGIIEDKYLYYDDTYFDNEISSVDIISSCFFLISSELLRKINFMDENIFLFYEECVISKKVKELGQMVVVYNKVKIKHLQQSGIEKTISNKDKYRLFKNSQIYYHTTYNNATWFDRFLFKLSLYMGLMFKSFYRRKRK